MYDIKWYKTIVWAIVADEAICVVGRVWVCVCVWIVLAFAENAVEFAAAKKIAD